MKKGDRAFLVTVTVAKEAAGAADSKAPVCANVSVTSETPELIPENVMDAIRTRFASVLVEELPAGMPPDRDVGHAIPLEEGSRPTHRPPRRVSPLENEEVRSNVTKLLFNDHIQPSKSPFGATVLFV